MLLVKGPKSLNFNGFLDDFRIPNQNFGMSVNHLLEVYTTKLPHIIQGLFITILGLLFVLIFFRLKNKNESGEESSNLEGLENTLKKMIESTQHLNSASAESKSISSEQNEGANSVAASSVSTEEMTKLQTELAANEKKLAEAMAKVGDLEKAQKEIAATPVADSSGSEEKIKDLEAKLKEYEIIEDDIANLSLYKEENIRLKNELSKAAGGNALPVEAEPVESNSEKLEDALEAAGGLPAVDTPPVTPPSKPDEPTEDLVSQLAAVVDNKSSGADVVPEPTVSLEPQAAPAAVDNSEPTTTEPVAATTAPEPPAEAPEALKGFDTEKILEEATHLKEPEPGKDVPEEEGDVGQKLIDEFENFMKES